MQSAKPVKRAREQRTEEDDWVHPIGNDASVACVVFLLLARHHVPGDVHPTLDLAQCALHMVWASVDESSPTAVARQSFLRLATPGAVRLTNVNRNATVPSPWPTNSPFRSLWSICQGPRANVIVQVDTQGLTGVTEIGDNFLYECSSLRTVNLRGLAHVSRVGGFFLADCSELKVLDLAPLARVTAIRSCFLSRCASLTALDLAPLSQLTELPDEFLTNCSSLQSLDCRPLRSVTAIGTGFLAGCSALHELDVSSFAAVTRIDEGFLHYCPALRSLDLSAMANVTEVDTDDLLGDHQLESLVRPEMGELATAAIAGL